MKWGIVLLMGIWLLAVETYLPTGILATSDYALHEQDPVLLRTCQACCPCDVTIDDSFSMGTLGQFDGTSHSDCLSFLNYLKPPSESGKHLIGNKRD